MRKKVLITGASGFIGQALLSHFLDRDEYDVLGLDIRKVKGPVTKIDLLDQKAVTLFLRKQRPSIIFHLAGGRTSEFQSMFVANIKTTSVLFNAIRDVKKYDPRIVVLGSAAEYGVYKKRENINEEVCGAIQNDYGMLKLLQTNLALYFARFGHDVIVARLFNIVGSGTPNLTVVGRFAIDIVKAERGLGSSILKVGNLSAVRDFLDIRDICFALQRLGEKGRTGEIYNICSGKAVAIKGLLKQMLSLSLKDGLRFQEDAQANPGVLRAVGSSAKLKKETGWSPSYTLKQSLQATLEYYRRIDTSLL